MASLSHIDPSRSILFVGSGFSAGTTNIRKSHPPVAAGLKAELARLLKVEPASYDLKTLADEINSRPELNLYQLLYELFTISDVSGNHRFILELPWKRFYTTNYDDAIEFVRLEHTTPLPSYNYDDEKPPRLVPGSMIHLHGIIRKATPDNILEQLVLNEASYIRQHFERSLWYDEFVRDLRFSTACFFLGYSLSDYHISALLMENPAFRDKTYFIARSNPDPIFVNRVSPFGEILKLEISDFAQLCRNLPQPKQETDPHALAAFLYLDPFKDKRSLAPPTPIEILNLVAYGSFNYQRCLSTLPSAEYVIPRVELVHRACAELRDARCLLLHSRIGNGKSIFLHLLAHRLSEQGYRCFWCRSNPRDLHNDLALFERIGKCVIFFDSYNTAMDLLPELKDLPAETKFVVAARTGVQEVRLHEIQTKMPSPLRRLSLNEINETDKKNFRKLLNKAGVRAAGLDDVLMRCREVREIVVLLYKNTFVLDQVKQALAPLFEDRRMSRVLIASLLLKWIDHDPDPAFLRSVTGADPYLEASKFREITGDLMRFDDDDLRVRSAVFAEYIVTTIVLTEDLLDMVYRIVVEAVRRKSERRYQPILSNLMRFSFLEAATRENSERLVLLDGLYDRMHRDMGVNEEPLFWLQYSILMTAVDDLVSAEAFIRTAYARAAQSPGFQTFQIDTYALRLLLLIEARATKSGLIERFD